MPCKRAMRWSTRWHLGSKLVWVPARAPADVSPGHNQHDWFWARLAERGVPFVLHVGSGPLPIASEWTNRRPRTADPRAGARGDHVERPDGGVSTDRALPVRVDTRRRARASSAAARRRHRDGRRLGAADAAQARPRRRHLEQIGGRAQADAPKALRTSFGTTRFTPYPFEDVGQLCRESDPTLYLFSSDYPHAEGGRDPIGRFSRSLAGVDEATRNAFFAGNARDWLGLNSSKASA